MTSASPERTSDRTVAARRWFGLLLLLVLAASATLLVRGAISDSITNDEGIYIHTGVCALTSGVVDLEATNPAGMKLLGGVGALASGVPVDHVCTDFRFETLSPLGMAIPYDDLRRLVLFARVPIMLCTLGLVVVSALWARAMAGGYAGLVAAALVGFNPTVVAHGHIVTGDLPVTFGAVAFLAALWRWDRGGGDRWAVCAGLALGFALLNKASALLLLPIAVMLLFVWGTGGALRARLRSTTRFVLVSGVFAYLIIFAAYAPFRSVAADDLPLPRWVSFVVVGPWWWGVKWQLFGHVGSGGVYYLNGAVREGRSFLYLPEAYLLKTPILIILLVVAGIALGLVHRRRTMAWTALPAVVLGLAACASGIQIGLRYALPSIALLSVAGACGLAVLRARSARTVTCAAVVGGVLATASGPVGSMGYFSIIGARTPAYYLSDSNLDFGQDGWRLRQWWLSSGQPTIQTDYFGYVPADYYVPGADEIAQHPERGHTDAVPWDSGTTLVVSVTYGVGLPSLHDRVLDPDASIGTGLVVLDPSPGADGP